MPSRTTNQTLPPSADLWIEKIVAGGDGLARHEGKVWFIRGAWTGEKVRAQPIKAAKDYVRAEAVEILEPCDTRRLPDCPWQASCGGCPWMMIDEAEQRRTKVEVVQEVLQRAGLPEFSALQIQPCLPVIQYRGVVEWHLRWQGRCPQLVFYKARSREPVGVDRCLTASPNIQQMYTEAVQFLAATRWADEAGWPVVKQAEWRWTFRENRAGNGGVLVWRTSFPVSEAVKSWALTLYEASENINGVVHWQQPKNRRAGGVRTLLIGVEDVEDRVEGEQFKVPADSFFQPHVAVSDALVRKVQQHLTGVNGAIWDLYSGSGMFGFALAGPERELHLVEADPLAAKAAIQRRATVSAEIEVHGLSIQKFLEQSQPKPQALVLDPPRTGVGAETSKVMAEKQIEKIVWVSCDIPTLARDLKPFFAKGYEWGDLTLFDAFPQTPHVEAIALLRLVN